MAGQDIIKFSLSNRKNGEFSNFYQCDILFQGNTYKNSESIYQSFKTLDMDERKKFVNYDGATAKKMGRKLKVRDDWEEVKYDAMVTALYAKFSQNDTLKILLLSTDNAILLEDTTRWHDNTWGNCNCAKCKDIPGQNLLGKALMEVRDRIRAEQM